MVRHLTKAIRCLATLAKQVFGKTQPLPEEVKEDDPDAAALVAKNKDHIKQAL